VLVVLVLVLVRLTIPRGPEQGYPSPGQETGYEVPVGPVEGFMELAIKGQPYSQLNIYLELKHAFMLRVRTRRGLDEERWVYVLSNPGVMQRAINDPELYRFSLLEDKGTFDLEQYRRIGVVLGEGFLERYEQLLRKVEDWA
jgi:hypothetical protein